MTKSSLSLFGSGGDMRKVTYDSNNDGLFETTALNFSVALNESVYSRSEYLHLQTMNDLFIDREYLVYDDFGDNSNYSSRTGSTCPFLNVTSGSVIYFNGTYRPNWSQYGKNFNMSKNTVWLGNYSGGDGFVTNYGTFNATYIFTFTKLNSNAGYGGFLIGHNLSNCHWIALRQDANDLYFIRNSNQILSQTTWTGDTNPHVFMLTVSPDGQFTLYEDNISKLQYNDTSNLSVSVAGFRGYPSSYTANSKYQEFIIK